MSQAGSNARSWEIAEIALQEIRSLDLPAGPESFELWYAYASGMNVPLNEAVHGLLAQHGRISEADANRLYETFLSSRRFVERLSTLADQLSGEIAQVEKSIAATINSSDALSAELGGNMTGLDRKKTQEELGALIEGLMVSTREFQRVNQVQLGQLQEAEKRAAVLQQSVDEIRHEGTMDALTSLANRGHFDAALQAGIASTEATGSPLALLFCDVDHFKKFNDQYGHLVGDQILRLVASTMKKNLRDCETGARYGGEEIVAILPNTTLDMAKAVGERIRLAIQQTEIRRRGTGEKLASVTISVGVAIFHAGETADEFVERADACMYAAKSAGRNCTIGEGEVKNITQGQGS